MHLLSCFHIQVIRCRQIIQNHLDCLQCKWICKWTVECWYISFDRMCQCIHSCVSNLFLRKSFYQFRINDCNIWCDIKVCQRIFDSCIVICDYGECCYFCCSSWCRWDGCKFCFLTKFRETEWCDNILECFIRILIEYPHSFSRIDWRSTAHCYDPVRLEFLHYFCALHNSLYRRIRFYTFDQFDFHSAFFQVVHCFVQESLTFHRSAADYEDSFFTFQIF